MTSEPPKVFNPTEFVARDNELRTAFAASLRATHNLVTAWIATLEADRRAELEGALAAGLGVSYRFERGSWVARVELVDESGAARTLVSIGIDGTLPLVQ